MDNLEKANYGLAAMKAGTPDFGQNPDAPIIDLTDTLNALMHYARIHKIEFSEALTDAEMHFEEEVCRTPGCNTDAGDGEGYNGYCGSCADKREKDDA